MISRICKFDLCLGCGLCASVIGGGKVRLHLSEQGFYEPIPVQPLTNDEVRRVRRTCPGIRVHGRHAGGHWGCVKAVAEAWSSNPKIRKMAASGGAVSALLIHLLETHAVDAVLQVGVAGTKGFTNELQISRTREDVVRCAQSRYAPARMFDRLREILDSGTEVFAFVGKPCDIAAIDNFIREFPSYRNRIAYKISIFCAGMPSYEGTRKVCRRSGRKEDPDFVRYRGDGWPGTFLARYADGFAYEVSYETSWGEVLSRCLPFRCKICPDSIGVLADIAVGDSWATADGYPDFTEAEGRSFCLLRTEKGVKLMHDAVSSGRLVVREFKLHEIQFKQPYQFERRKLTGWRVLPVQVLSGFLLSFRGLSMTRLALKAGIPRGILELWGAFRRMVAVLRKHGK